MKVFLLLVLLFTATASAHATYFKCSISENSKNIIGESASFGMSQGQGGWTVDGLNFMSVHDIGVVGDYEKDDKGNELTMTDSNIISEQPLIYVQKFTVKKENDERIKFTCQNLPDEAVVVQSVAPASFSGHCNSYDDFAADGSQCGLRSRDSRVRPY